MGSLKKFDGSSWINSNLRKLTTDTDTFTTFPAIIYAEGTNATVGLKGNTVQNGTPTPDSPIIPQGTGDLETSGAKAGQYKIPISSANTTTPVYLGEVQTTRKIKKLVLTGEETIRLQSINEYNIGNFYINIASVAKDGLSSHLEKQNTIISQTQTEGFLLSVSGAITTLYMRISTSRASTTTELQTWLSNQYASGTPVTVWYVLATPETTVVNEPLMRIGDDADTLSNISIPVTAEGDTLSVSTTVQPSEVTANYYGWHTITVHERESGQWD